MEAGLHLPQLDIDGAGQQHRAEAGGIDFNHDGVPESKYVDQNQDGQGFGADHAWLYVTILTVGYMVSRGLAKAGSREPFWSDPRSTADFYAPSKPVPRATWSINPTKRRASRSMFKAAL